MKKVGILLFMAVLGFTSLTACSSDDSTAPVVEQEKNHLLGKWNATSTHMKFEVDGEVLFDDLDKQGGPMNGIVLQYDFKDEKTVETYMYLPERDGEEAVESRYTTTYEKNGDQLIIKNYPKSYKILLLTEKNLNIYTINESVIEGKKYKVEEIDKYERMK